MFKAVPALVDPKQVTLVALTLGVLIALGVVLRLAARRARSTPFAEGTRLMDSVGWAAVLPQMLASLGAVFALAGVGEVVGGIAGGIIPEGSLPRCGGGLRARHGGFHDDHGQRLRRLPGDVRRRRHAGAGAGYGAATRSGWRRSACSRASAAR